MLVVTNQACIARGLLTPESLDEIHSRMLAEAARAGGRIDGVFACPHGWNDGCPCRKPAPGLLFAAQREWALDLSKTWFCGDEDRDREAAAAAGCRFLPVDNTWPLDQAAERLTSPAHAQPQDNAWLNPGEPEWLSASF